MGGEKRREGTVRGQLGFLPSAANRGQACRGESSIRLILALTFTVDPNKSHRPTARKTLTRRDADGRGRWGSMEPSRAHRRIDSDSRVLTSWISRLIETLAQEANQDAAKISKRSLVLPTDLHSLTDESQRHRGALAARERAASGSEGHAGHDGASSSGLGGATNAIARRPRWSGVLVGAPRGRGGRDTHLFSVRGRWKSSVGCWRVSSELLFVVDDVG